MNFLKSLVFSITLFGSSIQAATITWSETSPSYNLNDTFTLDVVGADFFSNVDGGGVNISFDPSIIKVLSVSIDESVWNFGGAGISTGVIDNVSGKVDGVMVNTLSNVSGNFVVTSIEFQVIGEGSSQLLLTEFEPNPWASAGSLINPEFVNTTFSAFVTPVGDGDLNFDGQVNIADLLLATQIVLGLKIPTSDEILHGDVAPLMGGVPDPDGELNAGDLLLIQRKVLGLVNF